MSEQSANRRIFEEIIEAYATKEFERALSLIDPGVEWIEPGEMPGGDTYRGHSGVTESMTRFVGTWKDYKFTYHDHVEAGDHLLVRSHLSGKGRTSGAPMQFDQWQLWTFKDGKVVRMEMFLEQAEAREAAGLDPVKEGAK